MNTLDWVILGFLGYGFFRGIFRGLIKEVFGILGLLAGIVIGYFFSEDLSRVLLDLELFDSSWAKPVAFFALFLTVLVLFRLMAYLLSETLSWASLGAVNAFLGGLFGMAKWGMILTVVLVLSYSWIKKAGGEPPGIFQESQIFPALENYGELLIDLF